MDKFQLTNNVKIILGKLEWNNDRKGAALCSSDVLPFKTTVKTSVVVIFEGYKGGSWCTVMTDGARTIVSKEIWSVRLKVIMENGRQGRFAPVIKVLY